MARVTRRRSVGAPPEEVWGLVSDPERLPAWWHGVARVEDATEQGWTSVLTASRGKAVRADFTRVEADPPCLLVWRQEIDESPFERILVESLTRLELAPGATGETTVSIAVGHRARGLARLGFLQLRAAAAKQVEEALDGLEAAVEA
jgi:uncharacterized protein YndB with AHSA1/START domain